MGVSTSTMIVVDGSAGRVENMVDLLSCVIPCKRSRLFVAASLST